MAERGSAGIGLGGIIVILGIILMFVWSFWWGLIIALIGAHLYLVVKLGTTAPPWMKAARPKSVRKNEVG